MTIATTTELICFLVLSAVVVLGALVGIVPAIKAYGTDVAKNLTPQS